MYRWIIKSKNNYFLALEIPEAEVEINCVKFLLKTAFSTKSLKYLKHVKTRIYPC